jgi:chromosome segregation ATPase
MLCIFFGTLFYLVEIHASADSDDSDFSSTSFSSSYKDEIDKLTRKLARLRTDYKKLKEDKKQLTQKVTDQAQKITELRNQANERHRQYQNNELIISDLNAKNRKFLGKPKNRYL